MSVVKRIIDIDLSDRPREKLQTKGVQNLSDFELLQALIGSGNQQAHVSVIAKSTQRVIQQNGLALTYENLEQITGLGKAKITEILAAIELSRRYLAEDNQPILDSLEKVAAQLQDIKDKKREYFMCITLDGANHMLAKRTVSIGTLNTSLVHPREVFADAISDRAASIIVAHNHPSGCLTPSVADQELTVRLLESGKLLGIRLLDHLIIAKTGYRSI
jgi:DNA repair protein RadC